MYRVEEIKSNIKRLYKTNPNIHIRIGKVHQKLMGDVIPARIIGIYNNIFQVEEYVNEMPSIRRSFRYGDILVGQIVIQELNDIINKQ